MLDVFDADDAVVNWLPDGRYLRVSANGAITTAMPGATPAAGGTVAIPTGREIRGVWVNPQGSQMAMQLIVPGASDRGIDESDLWVATTNGSGLAQLTDTGITSYAKWSPDGDHIAFDTDTGLVCNGGGCTGQCSLWYTSASSRSVKALESSNDAEHFRVKNSRGEERSLGCDLLSWTE
jgi:Tol biopolymer transport system component